MSIDTKAALDDALAFAEGWVDAFRDSPEKIGYAYPPRPPISYEMLATLVDAAWAHKLSETAPC